MASLKKSTKTAPRGANLPGAGVMAFFAPLIIGGAVVAGAFMLWRQHERKIRVVESSRVEEELRADILAAYRSLRLRHYADTLNRLDAAGEKMDFLMAGGFDPAAYSDFRAALSILEAQAEFARDPKANAAGAERKFDAAISLISHASGEIWESGVLGRARIRLELGKFREAAQDLDILLAGNPNYGDAYYWRSLAKQNMDDREGAEADRKKAEALGSWPPLRDFLRWTFVP